MTLRLFRIICVVLIVAGLLGIPLTASAADYSKTINSNGCVITVHSSTDAQQAKQDVDNVAATLQKLLDKSADMVKKVTEACKNNGNAITINVWRDDPSVTMGQWVHGAAGASGHMDVDLGDIAAIKSNMTGPADEVNTLADNMLTDVLAHEFDHARGAGHSDPADDSVKGPAVEDANTVLSQMGVPASRNAYRERDKNGNVTIPYTVNGKSVVISATTFVKSRSESHKFFDPVDTPVDSELFLLIPDHPCAPAESSGC